MNNKRRKILGDLCDRIKSEHDELQKAIAKHRAAFEAFRDEVDTEREGEQESFDNLSEGLQASERGQDIEAAISSLDAAFSSLDELIGHFDEFEGASPYAVDEIIQQIDEARGQ